MKLKLINTYASGRNPTPADEGVQTMTFRPPHPPRLLSALVATLLLASATRAQPFAIDWSTIDCGGGAAGSGPFMLMGTLGQPDAGPAPVGMSGGSFTLVGGFWVGAGAPPCPADFNLDGTVNTQDFFDFLAAFFRLPPRGRHQPRRRHQQPGLLRLPERLLRRMPMSTREHGAGRAR
jgi:hypothetical protein